MITPTVLPGATLALAALALCVPSALAGGVRIVDPAGARDFPDIQSAIDAANDGDILLVGAGAYPGFTLDGKSLSIYAVPGGPQGVAISGGITVRNLLAGSAVLQGFSAGPLTVTSCAGDVRFQDCTFTGANGSWGPGYPAGDLVQSTRVVLAACTFRAGTSLPYAGSGYGFDGLQGLRLQSSTVAMYESSAIASRAGNSIHDNPGTGGPGILVVASWLFASRCGFQGGGGGDDLTSVPIVGGGCGGAGMSMDAGSSVHLLDVSAAGGPGGLPSMYTCGYGPAILNQGGLLDPIPGTARTFGLAAITPDRTPWSLSVSGPAGDQIFLNRSYAPVFQYEPTLSGVCTALLPPFGTANPSGVLPGSGVLTVPVRQRLLPDDVIARVYFQQGFVIETGGATVLGTPLHTLSLNWNSPPDCNANGIQDYAEVIFGVTPDADHDLVPDGCP